jgi:large subunit ribosomal protein L37Ae
MVSRYGVKIRKREKKITEKMRASHACPKCGKKSVSRKGTAQWHCKSCGATFTGGAYVPQTQAGKEAVRSLSRVKEE